MKETVLMIDDDIDDIHLAEEAFNKMDKDISFTYLLTGEQVSEYLDQSNPLPNLILLDLNMPLRTGKEVLSDIKENKKYAAIPVVIFTTSISETDRRECFRLQANSVVSKPALFNYWEILLESLCAIFLRACASKDSAEEILEKNENKLFENE